MCYEILWETVFHVEMESKCQAPLMEEGKPLMPHIELEGNAVVTLGPSVKAFVRLSI